MKLSCQISDTICINDKASIEVFTNHPYYFRVYPHIELTGKKALRGFQFTEVFHT